MTSLADIAPGRPLLLIGGGRMGRALLGGWIDAGLAPQAAIVIEPDPVAAAALKGEWPDLYVTGGYDQLDADPSVIVLAVKPQIMDEVLANLAGFTDALFLSIAAGKTLAGLSAALGGKAAIIRAMPNTPAQIGFGASVCVANGAVSKDQRALCASLLGAVGIVEWVDDEALMDAVTAVSGSGPAYVFYFAECLARAAEEAGLPAGLAARIARQTVVGAGALLGESEDVPAALRQAVTSPGGTTEAALNVLMGEEGLEAVLKRAVEAAAKRSCELS